jgi:biotin operon repressor
MTATMGSSRVAIGRMAEIVALAAMGSFQSADVLAKQLGVCHKTIIRDLRFLRDRGHQLTYDPKLRRWTYNYTAKPDAVLHPNGFAPVALQCGHQPYGADPCRQRVNLMMQPRPEKILWKCPDCDHGNVWVKGEQQ